MVVVKAEYEYFRFSLDSAGSSETREVVLIVSTFSKLDGGIHNVRSQSLCMGMSSWQRSPQRYRAPLPLLGSGDAARSCGQHGCRPCVLRGMAVRSGWSQRILPFASPIITLAISRRCRLPCL